MDIDVMQRKLNVLTKFRDDVLTLITREGTQEAFDAMVAERKVQAAVEASDRAAAAAEPAGEDVASETGDQKPPAGAGEGTGGDSGDGKGIDQSQQPKALGEAQEGGKAPDPALSGATS